MKYCLLLLLTLTGAYAMFGSDKDFITSAADGGKLEVELGQKAQEKAASGEVKKLAAMIVQDHTRANAELATLASTKGVTLDSNLSMKSRAKVAKMSLHSGDGFDKAYIAAMVDDHKEDILAFQQASVSAQDPAVRKFAEKMLPTLRNHLEKAVALQREYASAGR
ncbi:DUF4142 domain-containing protein [Paludibaculum fermentans]|uniref:DUF4142 domain-containing protein n=1 Tax=Paludibaculum fermentans TaxID=1473598 RepID=UPI003EBB03CE